MKTNFLVIISLFSQLVLAAPADQNIVDQYVQIAISNDIQKIKGSGLARCKYEFSNNVGGVDSDNEGHGKNIKEASQSLALLCIKERCQQVGQWILFGLRNFDQVSEADNAEFLKTQGHSDLEIATILKNRKEMDRSKLSQITCETATPTARMAVFDSCFSVPMNCLN